MEYINLGKSGVMVSRLCLGTMNFGPYTSEADSFKIMDEAIEQGINFFDTANVYGKVEGEGITEQIIGRWFAQGNRRNKVILATKVYGKMGPGPNDRRLSAVHIRKACEDSLKRLQTDHIDLYQMHHIDLATPWEEIWQAMQLLVQQGKVIYIGSSNFAGWQLAQACESARNQHLLGLVSEQSIYNLKDRSIELEVIPACRNYGLGLLPWSPLAGGLLSGVLSKEETGRHSTTNARTQLEKFREKLIIYETLCREIGESPAVIALSWLLKKPVVTAPIIGPRTLEQLNSMLRSLMFTLDETVMEKLNETFPGPGGEAPMAYAW